MKKLLLAIFLFTATLTFSQEATGGYLISTPIDTVGAGLVGTAFLLPTNAVPVGVYVDTLTDAATLSFEVLFGAVTQDSVTSGEQWRLLTEQDNGAANWTATLTDDKFVPLDPAVMMSLLGKSDAYAQQTVWLRPVLSAQQDKPIILYIRVRWI